MTRGTVEICTIEPKESFICKVNGYFTIDALKEIEEEFLENYSEDIQNGVQSLIYDCYYFQGQYGEFGMCEMAPGWELTLIGKEHE